MTDLVVIIGAGPAGLTAAYALCRKGLQPLVLEKTNQVGGLARTEVSGDFRFDIGGHRFFTKIEEINSLWSEVLGSELLRVKRLSRIFLNGRFLEYPLSIPNVLRNLGVLESLLILASYGKARLFPIREEENFEQWVTNRFGERLYRTFFKTYTEKVWGIPCSEIRADWAAQRIKGLSLFQAVKNALFSSSGPKTLIRDFRYPRLGPGQMWEKIQDGVNEAGGRVEKGSAVHTLDHSGNRVRRLGFLCRGRERSLDIDQVLSTMPLPQLVRSLCPSAPQEILQAAAQLRYRDFIIVVLIMNQRTLFPDNWIYVHSSDVRVGRIQNFQNWSAALVGNPDKTSLGMEYFCTSGDELWDLDDDALTELAKKEIGSLGLAQADLVEDAFVIRQKQAYPVYDADYRTHLDVIRRYLSRFSNLQTLGRNGLHRYNNQDHSMLCALYAVENLFGASHGLWAVNTERSYHEDYELTRTK